MLASHRSLSPVPARDARLGRGRRMRARSSGPSGRARDARGRGRARHVRLHEGRRASARYVRAHGLGVGRRRGRRLRTVLGLRGPRWVDPSRDLAASPRGLLTGRSVGLRTRARPLRGRVGTRSAPRHGDASLADGRAGRSARHAARDPHRPRRAPRDARIRRPAREFSRRRPAARAPGRRRALARPAWPTGPGRRAPRDR